MVAASNVKRDVLRAEKALIDAASEAIDQLDAEGQAAAQAALDRIRSAGYAPAAIESEAAALWASSRLRVAAMVLREVGDAARLADRVEAERAAGARGIFPPASSTRVRGKWGTEQALAGSLDAPLVAPGTAAPRPPPGPLTTKAGAMLRELGGPPKPEIALSERLHGSVAKAQAEAMIAIRRTIREGQSLDISGKTLIREVRAAGLGELGQGQAVPRYLQDLHDSGRRLQALGHAPGSPEYIKARKEWDGHIARLDRKLYGPEGAGGRRIALNHGDLPDYLGMNKRVGGLADRRGAYAELRQILDKQGPAGMDKAFSRWTAEKQRENAERILRTEQAAAYRARQVRQYRASGAIKGVIWRLSQGSRRRYVARVAVRKSGPNAGRRCLCEAMAGHMLSLDEAMQWPRMGHPHCQCYWEPVYRAGGRGGPITQEELEDFEG